MGKARIRHLPPTAVPIARDDFRYGMAALFDPGGSLESFQLALSKRWLESRECYLTSSGRAALVLILMSLRRLSDRKQVILPAYSCSTVVQSVLVAGLEPVFCDVSPVTLDLEREALSRLIDVKPLAILPTHLYGLAHNIKDLLTLGQVHGIFIIEDAAQAFGAKIEGKIVGSLGDAGFYSLGRGKCIPTGHGGVIVAQEKLSSVISDTIRSYLPLTIRREVGSMIAFLAYGVLTRPEGWWFVTRSPLNPASAGMDIAKLPSILLNRMSATQAGLGISILNRLEKVQAIGKQNAALLMKRLADFKFISCFEGQPAAEPVFLRLPILVEGEARANKLFESLNQAGIGVSRSYCRTLPDLFPEHTAQGDVFPGAERLANCLLTLPTHSYMNDIDFDRITMVFHTVDHR